MTYKVKFNIQWHTEFPCVEAVKNDPVSFNCTVCEKKMLSCHHGGKRDVRDHVETKTHKEKVKAAALKQQSTLSFAATGLSLNDKVSHGAD